MTPLRQRIIENLPLRGLAERTQEMDVRAVRHLAAHDHTSPARITEEALRDAFLSLTPVQHASRSASTIALYGITFFYAETRKRAWTTLTFVRPPQQHTLPVILSLEAVHTMLQCVRLPRSRACLRTLSACGLRLQEGTHLQGPARARARMVVHGRHGTGAKDRDVPLPPPTLAMLRPSWHTHRHPVWLFPAPGRRGLGLSTASTPLPRTSVQDALRAALRARGLHTCASGHTWRHAWATPLRDAGVHLRRLQHSLGPTAPSPLALAPYKGRFF